MLYPQKNSYTCLFVKKTFRTFKDLSTFLRVL